MAEIKDKTIDENGNIIYNIEITESDSISLNTRDTYVDKNIIFNTDIDLSSKQDKLKEGYGIKIAEDGTIYVDGLNDTTESFGPDDFQKAMLQYFDIVGEKDATMKPYAQKIRNSILNMEEFGKEGSGLFIHWGVYSVPAGHYTGPKQPGSTVTATDINYNTEWSLRDLGIPLDVYKAYQDQFTGTNFDAEAICQLAVGLGMKYIIITTKHHEGFCLAPTENSTGWDIKTAACRNTILDELKAACDKYKLKLGFYYSHYWDWMNEGGFGLNHGGKWTTTDPYTPAQHTEYCNKAIKQIAELIETYKPHILWYDPGSDAGSTYKAMFRNAEKEKYPNIITNDRLGYARDYGDYGTGERTIYLRSLPYGESCFTLNNTWGYSVNNETESSYFTLEKILKQFMLYTISYGQNCVLNVGPKPDGSLPPLTLTRLTQLKTFIDAYAPGGFYDYKRMSINSRPKFGYMIGMPNNKVLCFVITPNNKNYSNVVIDGVDTTLLKENGVTILTPGTNASYEILDDHRIQISNLNLDSVSKIGVVQLEYTNTPPHLDYVTAENHEEISSRVFPVNSNTYDFTKCCHAFSQSSGVSGLKTHLLWNDDDKNCTIKLNYTWEDENNKDISTTIVVTDLEDETLTQTFSYGANETAIETKFDFQQGHKYEITYSATGSINKKVYFNGFSIDYNEVEPVTGITVTPTSVECAVGGYEQLVAHITPPYATDTSVTWTSSNENVATVSSGGFVMAEGLGSCVITATTNDGGYTATCNVTVKDIPVESVDFEEHVHNLYQGQSAPLAYHVYPENAGNKEVTWSSSDTDIVTVTDEGIVYVKPDATTAAVITVRTVDGGKTSTCVIMPVVETYDYIFEAESLDGSDDQGDDTGLLLFSDDMPNWTLVSYVQNSKNPNTDNNATLYQIVVNASPWSGLRVDADNNNYPSATTSYSPLIPRFLAGTDNYINPITGARSSSKPNVNPQGQMHPVCFSRNGDSYKYSLDGVNWYNLEGITTAQLTRLKPCKLTIGFDYRRSSGQITTNKYRKLKTDNPCCVAIKYTSEFPFWKLYDKYDDSRVPGEIIEVVTT